MQGAMQREAAPMTGHATGESEPAHNGRDVVFTTWVAHPAREQPGRAAMGVTWIIAAAVVVYATTFNVFWPVFAVLFLLAALNRFFFPTRFDVDDEGITATSLFGTRRMTWRQVRKFVHDETGGLLSDRARHSRLDALRGRGVHVMFGRAGDRAVRAIKERLQQARESVNGSDSRQPTTESGGHD
jgi:hypothetical protein